jgi:ribosomal protein S18 acetylase RimI-like enzyme
VWYDEAVVAHGERMYPAQLPGFVALQDGAIVGHVSYRLAGRRCELTSIETDPPGRGIGSLLLDAVVDVAGRVGCTQVWLTTTNDNLDALRFYQRRGFRLSRLRVGAIDAARRALKPELPAIGSYGIPMRDELDLERELA